MALSAPPALPTELTQTKPPQTNGTVRGMTPASTKLPKLPIPKLEDTCKRYLRALEGLQDPAEHERTKKVVHEFLTGGEGERWQKRLLEYDKGVESYIEEFWCKSQAELS